MKGKSWKTAAIVGFGVVMASGILNFLAAAHIIPMSVAMINVVSAVLVTAMAFMAFSFLKIIETHRAV